MTAPNDGKHAEKLDHSYIAVGMYSGTAALDRILKVSLKTKHILLSDLAIKFH